MGASRLSRTDHVADPFEIADVEGVGSLVEPVLAQRLRELVGEREAREAEPATEAAATSPAEASSAS